MRRPTDGFDYPGVMRNAVQPTIVERLMPRHPSWLT
jgi:hypothetical protein